MNRTLIHNARIVDGPAPRLGYILVEDTRIAQKASGPAPQALIDSASEAIDARGAYLLHGLVDTHVHFREPGLEHKGDIRTESLAAAAGGVTQVFDMPNTVPATTDLSALAAKTQTAREKGAYVRYTPLMGIVPGGTAQLASLAPGTLPAVKLFLGTSTGNMRSPEGRELEELFRICAALALPIIVHAEDNAIIARNMDAALARYGTPEAIPVSQHHHIRSREACLRASAAAVELAERFGTRLHLAHVTTADEVHQLLSEGPTKGKLITAETTPLYLDPALADENMRTALHKVNPAIKTPADAQALRDALATGAIDTIATDHAPHLLHEKTQPGMKAASGAPSVQFALPLMLTYLDLWTVVRKMTLGPADIFGITACRLNPGDPADLTLLREVPEYRITADLVLSRCAWTPFENRLIHHRVERTWVAGTTVYADGQPAASVSL